MRKITLTLILMFSFLTSSLSTVNAMDNSIIEPRGVISKSGNYYHVAFGTNKNIRLRFNHNIDDITGYLYSSNLTGVDNHKLPTTYTNLGGLSIAHRRVDNLTIEHEMLISAKNPNNIVVTDSFFLTTESLGPY